MRTIMYETVVESVRTLVIETSYNLPGDVIDRLSHMRSRETSARASGILDQILANAHIASKDRIPLCQDTGTAVFFVDCGKDAVVGGDGLTAAVNEGMRRGYKDGGLRMSIVRDPLRRVNSNDNSPAYIHLREVPGDELVISFCPKGGGCENMSRQAMLTPGEGREGVISFVVDTVGIGGGRPCPPVVVGVGIGGTFEYSAIIAKRTLLRKLGDRNPDPYYREMEEELIDTINSLGIGPMGLGGDTTALDVFVEAAPCHIASMPVAVNIQCHSARHGTVSL